MIVIYRDARRYGDTGKQFPWSLVVAGGDKAQADALAEYMSDHFPGCDGLFYVEVQGE